MKVTARKKLWALRELGKRIGMWGDGPRCTTPELTPERLARVVLSALVVMDPEASPIQRGAAVLILDYYIPHWREDNPTWGVTARNDKRVNAWKRAVLERDGYRCVRCGSEDRLHVHHIVPWAEDPSSRVDVNNGETLCSVHHSQEHPDLEALVMSSGAKR